MRHSCCLTGESLRVPRQDAFGWYRADVVIPAGKHLLELPRPWPILWPVQHCGNDTLGCMPVLIRSCPRCTSRRNCRALRASSDAEFTRPSRYRNNSYKAACAGTIWRANRMSSSNYREPSCFQNGEVLVGQRAARNSLQAARVITHSGGPNPCGSAARNRPRCIHLDFPLLERPSDSQRRSSASSKGVG